MSQPDILYHASPSTDVTILEPRSEYPRYPGEANLVFATPLKELAAMFLVPRDIETEIGIYGDRYVVFINSSAELYAEQDKGGAIYSLPVDTFETDSVHGMGEIEWYSKVPVQPLSKVVYGTSIEAMDTSNVERFFVNNNTFEKIRANPSDALRLVE
jgi:hypothetical protein